MRLGPTAGGHLGLEHFGNAMHTVEDFYAHSNFVELGRCSLRGSGDPKTGYFRDDPSRAPIVDSLGRFRLTTGSRKQYAPGRSSTTRTTPRAP